MGEEIHIPKNGLIGKPDNTMHKAKSERPIKEIDELIALTMESAEKVQANERQAHLSIKRDVQLMIDRGNPVPISYLQQISDYENGVKSSDAKYYENELSALLKEKQRATGNKD